jgi:arylsulfatase A-like enzyme
MTSEPNVVFIMPDQLRHDFLSCYDASFMDTPNIDALCAQGFATGTPTRNIRCVCRLVRPC